MRNRNKLQLLEGLENSWGRDWLEKTRRAIEESENVALPEDGRYYENMHAKIMAAVLEADSNESHRPSTETWTDSLMTALQRKYEDSVTKR